MSPIFDLVALQLVTAIFLLLVSALILLTIVSVTRRTTHNRHNRLIRESEEYILPIIYQFMDKDITRKEFSRSMQSIHDTVAAFRNIVEMIDSFKDVERQRLRSLLGLRKFDEYFIEKLYSGRTVDIAQACSFYEKRIVAEKQVQKRLFELQQHPYTVISYAATLALVNMADQAVCDKALRKFLYRHNNATMAVHDIIFKYFSQHGNRDEAESKITELVAEPDMPVKNASAVLKMFPELNFYRQVPLLFELFTKELQHDHHGVLKATLLNVLNQFHEPGAGQEIKRHSLHRSDSQLIRLETARWIHENYQSCFDPELMELAADPDLEVRIVAQSANVKYANSERIDQYLPENLLNEWDEIKASGGAYVATF